LGDPKVEIQIVNNYREALSAAVQLTRTVLRTKMPLTISSRLRDEGITEYQEKGHQVLRCDQWKLDLDEYHLTVEVIDGDIYHAASSGVLQEHHIPFVIQMRETVCRMLELDQGFRAIITGTSASQGSEHSARKKYLASLKRWHDQHPMTFYVFYNANWVVRTAAVMAAPFLPFKVKLAQNLEHAIALVDEFTPKSAPSVDLDSSLSMPEMNGEEKVVNQLLHFINTIDWEHRGTPQVGHINHTNPFRPVFDAIALIKAELDELSEKQRATERKLRESQKRFTTVLDSVSTHICVVDFNSFEILFMNKSMRDEYGEHYSGARCFELIRNSDDVCPGCIKEKLVDDNGTPGGVYIWEWYNPTDQRWYLNHDRVIRWVDGRLARLQIATDITRIKKLELERQDISERLQQSRKLDAVSTMAGGVSHHFNNLLMVIMGNLELMRLEVPPESSLSNKIDALEDSARRAADLSTLLLTYVGQTKISPQVIDLNTILSEMVDVLKTTVAEKARLVLALSEEQTWIYADTSKTYEVITHLVDNAVEASGGQPVEIRMETGHRFCKKSDLDHLFPGQNLSKGYYVWLRMSDNGRGMEPETLEKVFDPFFTTKFTGRGLGMATVMGIMRAHRGGVHIKSRPDAGTVVTVYFPESKQTSANVSVKETKTAVADRSGNRGTIILVEDEPLVLELGKEMLNHMGFDVLTAVDGLEALALFDAHRERIRMAVLDVNMPRMGGKDTIKKLRDRGAAFPILVASGFTDAQSREKMGDVKVDGYIQKPFRLEQLKAKINDLFDTSET
jgi:signal transduction histidine kinase/CheY-like chemotaxis protein